MQFPTMRLTAEGLVRWGTALLIALGGVLSAGRSLAVNDQATAVAVADFDNVDTSGEATDRTAQHAVRVRDFASLLRDGFVGLRNYQVVRLQCEQPTCSAAGLGADALIATARRAGARLLVYGGIHKMSTLIQLGEVQVIDLEREQLLLSRSFTFRGDSDEAFHHAAGFIRESLQNITLR